jgi:DNA-directed RNA polymerase II subunit RPB4
VYRRKRTRPRCGSAPVRVCAYTRARRRAHRAVEFNTAGCLVISEVKVLLETVRDRDVPDTACVSVFYTLNLYRPLNPDGCRVYNKTLEYVRTFAKFTTADATMAVRTALGREPALTQFETAQIANLCPADADEAKSIVPRCASTL